ncbi:MAG: ferrous iron transport protein A [Methanosphaera sp.]|nr:ferrous iron transport protein A [Methanosphaera sp.]
MLMIRDDFEPSKIVRTRKVKGVLGEHLREVGLVSSNSFKLEQESLGYPVGVRLQDFSWL